MSKINTAKQEVEKWIAERKGWRKPVYAPGKYKSFAESKTAAFF